MTDLPRKIIEFIADSYEHLFDQSFIRALTLKEQQLFRASRQIAEEFELEGQLQNAGIFTGILSTPDDEEIN